MKGSRVFKRAAFFIVILAVLIALVWYGMQLEGRMLLSRTRDIFAISMMGLILSIIVPAVTQQWWRRPIDGSLVRRRLGAFYYVVWSVLLLNIAAYAAISHRIDEIRGELLSPLTELDLLSTAMSLVVYTLFFSSVFLLLRVSRAIGEENAEAPRDS